MEQLDYITNLKVSTVKYVSDTRLNGGGSTSNYLPVMIDLLLLVASHWVSQGEFLKTTDHNEEGKNTEGQNYDQDL